MKIQYDPAKPFEAYTRAFHFPCTVSDSCPKCGQEDKFAFEEGLGFLRNPGFNKPIKLCFCCESCDTSWERWIQLDLNVKAVVVSPKESPDASSS
jgi:hypothetical protein